MIDLRSDTVTRPTEGMRAAMAAAPVGDDVYGEDPSVARLERRVATLLGHEAALFCVSGSMANLLALRLLAEPGQEVLCDAQSHIVRAELGSHAAVHGLTTRTFVSPGGRLDAAHLADLAAPDAGPYLVSTAAVAVEDTHNFGGGVVQPFEQLVAVSQLCRSLGLGSHLDGARLWNAHVASGVALAEVGRLFDTVAVSFSKGLGAPVGSVLVASAERIARARVLRKRLGAGWRQAGILAAGCSYALDHHVERLAEDHAAAQAFALALADHVPEAVSAERTETNIVMVRTGDIPAAVVAARANESGVALSVIGPHVIRAVTHLDVTRQECRTAGSVVGRLLREPGR